MERFSVDVMTEMVVKGTREKKEKKQARKLSLLGGQRRLLLLILLVILAEIIIIFIFVDVKDKGDLIFELATRTLRWWSGPIQGRAGTILTGDGGMAQCLLC